MSDTRPAADLLAVYKLYMNGEAGEGMDGPGALFFLGAAVGALGARMAQEEILALMADAVRPRPRALESVALLDHSFHWWHAERSSYPAICQWMGDKWWCINEAGGVTTEELRRRGWEYLGPVSHRPVSDYLDR